MYNKKMRDILVKEIFTNSNILIFFIVINLISFFIMWYDKHEAKINQWRVSEKTLFFLVLIGGGIGGIAGMHIFRHKTKKWYFRYGFPFIVLLQIVLCIIFRVMFLYK